MSYIIRRPVGMRRFKYNRTHAGHREWSADPYQAYLFAQKENADKHLKEHKVDYGPDDEVVEFTQIPYNAQVCPYCLAGQPRNIGTERFPGQSVVMEITCPNCNAQWQEKYTWWERVHVS